jgi:hypothetical protein
MPAIHVRLRCLCQLRGQDQWRLCAAYVTFVTACGGVVACRLSGLLVSGTESRGLLEAYIPPQDGPGRTHATAAAAAAATAWQRCYSWGHPLRPESRGLLVRPGGPLQISMPRFSESPHSQHCQPNVLRSTRKHSIFPQRLRSATAVVELLSLHMLQRRVRLS